VYSIAVFREAKKSQQQIPVAGKNIIGNKRVISVNGMHVIGTL
jgi:hypothetical protein